MLNSIQTQSHTTKTSNSTNGNSPISYVKTDVFGTESHILIYAHRT